MRSCFGQEAWFLQAWERTCKPLEFSFVVFCPSAFRVPRHRRFAYDAEIYSRIPEIAGRPVSWLGAALGR